MRRSSWWKSGSMVAMLALAVTGLARPGRTEAPVTEAWVARYNGPGNGGDTASKVVTDPNGYIYVTGSSRGNNTNWDFATIKYAPDGSPLWTARFSGPSPSVDQPTAMAVDGSGNVYVTGSNGSQYVTVKYDANGNQQWAAYYLGSGPGHNATAVAVDSLGNVYVTGTSNGTGTFFDYATIKYDPNGNQLWVARYNGPGSDNDLAMSIAVDGSGSVYVAGQSPGSGSNYDYATVKYDTNGNQLWVARYTSPGNSGDFAYNMVLDGTAHVYVTGGAVGSGGTLDYATVKYDTDGNQLWVARYAGPGADADQASGVAVDQSGQVYVYPFTGVRPGRFRGGAVEVASAACYRLRARLPRPLPGTHTLTAAVTPTCP